MFSWMNLPFLCPRFGKGKESPAGCLVEVGPEVYEGREVGRGQFTPWNP